MASARRRFLRALTGVEPVPQILERDRTQAEFTLTISQYFERRLTYDILKIAKESAERHRALLEDVEKSTACNHAFSSPCGASNRTSDASADVRPMIPALATLAYEPRRAAFFRQQLFDALARRRQGATSSCREPEGIVEAGAMGQPQFMPSSYLAYAQDFDGDGRRDIWTSQP